jgi:hypothetical protein
VGPVVTRFVLALTILVAPNAAIAQSTQSVSVRNLALMNLTQVPVDEYQQIVQFALSDDVGSTGPDTIPERIRYALQERGYFRAQVGDAVTTLVSETPTKKIVDITLRVDPGSRYTLAELIFSGNEALDVFSADQMRAQFLISPGDLFDTDKIRIGLENLRKLFADEGYINFIPVPNTEIIEPTKSIILSIDLDVGARFYFGNLEISAISAHPDAAWILNSDWSSLQGKPYNETVLETFMQQHSDLLPSGFRPERSLAIRQDRGSKTVQVELTR